ncbi:MAG: DUF1330 domain-containing protein [Reichenbachiella sp.]
MIYITQFVYLKEGKEDSFLLFEDYALPLLDKHKGRLIYRIRPDANSLIACNDETPYEMHFLSFESQEDLEGYMMDEERKKFIHLKDESIEDSFLVKGEKM